MDSRCPRKLKTCPTAPCKQGKIAVDLEKDNKHGGCPWFIADESSNYCFFKYMQDLGNRAVPGFRIATLLMLDDDEIKVITNKFKKVVSETENT